MTLTALNVAELRRQARRRLPRGIFEYIDRGTEDELGLDRNRRVLDALRLVPRVLVDVSTRDQAVELMGRPLAIPLVIAPTASAGLVWPRGEAVLARAASAAGVPFCVATGSITALEEIVAEAKGEIWFQLYLWRDRQRSFALVDRARAAGIDTLVLTVDTVVVPNREYNRRNGFDVPLQPSLRAVLDVLAHPGWIRRVLISYLRRGGMPTFAHYPPEYRTRITRGAVADAVALADTLSWDDLKALRAHWPGRLVVKGIMHPDDAQAAAEHGADAIVVSNHGGRNLDSAPAPAEMLPAIVERAGHRLTIMADSGVRRGSDVVKLMALGAKAVLIGRAPLYGTTVAGEAGAAHVLKLLRHEIDVTLALLGRRSITEIGPDALLS